MKYYFQSGSSIERNGFIALRGGFCEGCGGQVFDDGITVGFQCRNDKVMIFEPPPGFGCNLWERKVE